MATQLQLRRGTTAENNAFTGGNGEVTVDTDTHALRVHDGSTVGGFEVDTVVYFQQPTASNNYTWVRKYASGWVEQGQYKCDITKNQANIVTLPVPMANTNFGGSISCSNITYGAATTLSIDSHSTTQVNLWGYTGAASSTIRVSWEVKGMAA